MEIPVFPANVSQRVITIYQDDQELGNDPRAFSIIGDCDATPTCFLNDFNLGPKYYSLGQYEYLQALINQFQGSFGRQGIAVKRGFRAASVLAPLWADPEQCQTNETPLAFEIRIHNLSFMFILLDTNDIHHQDLFESNMHQNINILIEDGIVLYLS